ncbi:hypothetical protein FRB99_002308, partial [Tulasnella sp. 403]
TTSSGADTAKEAILTNTGNGTVRVTSGDEHTKETWQGRLTTLDMDVKDEAAIEQAAEDVKNKFGNQVRLVINVSGILHAEKNLGSVSQAQLFETFNVNTFGHLLVYKHFAPLLSHKKDTGDGHDDPARGVLPSGKNALVSISARVGSIGDNGRGGWYSYRSSKAALNQVIRSLSHEMSRRSPQHPALCIAYHPGTMKTLLSAPYTGNQSAADTNGLFEVDEAAEKLLTFLQGAKDDMSGGFWAYDGSRVPW